MPPAVIDPAKSVASNANTATGNNSSSSSTNNFNLLRRRSPLPNTFRAWHVVFSVSLVALLLSMSLWKAFQVHDVAVQLQQDRLGQLTIQAIREPVARLLKQVETVGSHARTITETYRTFGKLSISHGGNSFGAVCEAPPAGSCSPPLQRFMSTVGSYAESLYFVRYVYVSAATPESRYAPNATVGPTTTISPPFSSTTTTMLTAATSVNGSTSSNGTQTPTSGTNVTPNRVIHCGNESDLVILDSTTTTTTTTTTILAADETTTTMTMMDSNNNSAVNDTTSSTTTVDSNQTSSSTTVMLTATSTTTTSSQQTQRSEFWHECGCDLVEGCYFVDREKQRKTFALDGGFEKRSNIAARNLDGLDYIEWIKNLTRTDSRGEWSEPREYREIYLNASAAPTEVELLLQFSVPMRFDSVTGRCNAAASIDISTEFIASVLSAEEAANATFFFVDRRGPTLLGESSEIVANRVVRRKFNPLDPALPEFASSNVRRLMPLFRAWLGGQQARYLPENETRTQFSGYALASTPVGTHWVLLQAVGVSDLQLDEYQFMRHGRLYLPVVVGASWMLALLLIEFVHGTFPSAEWRFDDQAEEERRKRVEQQRALRRTKNNAGKSTTHRKFEIKPEQDD